MELCGYADRVAHVDLTARSVEYKPLPEEWALKYIGGRGLGVRYVFENGPAVAPLAPENLLCFMNGPLTGSAANMSGRLAVVTRSPLTGTVTDSHQGGWSGARLRWAGFDGLVIRGKASTPVYLHVSDGQVEIRDAAVAWGQGVHASVEQFRREHGKKDLSVIAIGPAGENLVRYACWINEDDRAAGRGGTGCVGGAKNLKAVVVKAAQALPEPSDKQAWNAARKRALALIRDEKNVTSPRKGGLSVFGTNVLMNITSALGALPAQNSLETSFGAGAEKLSGEHVKEHLLVADPTCHACPVACKKEVEVKQGLFAGLRMESVEYEPAWALGANCGNDDVGLVAGLIDLANDLGLDAIEIGDVLATYMEATAAGYTAPDPGLRWGDGPGMVETLRKVAFRQGIGDVLAHGVVATAERFGHPEIAMHCKGQGIPAYDPRGLKGMGLGYATSNRGACHLRAYTPASELGLIALKTDGLEWRGKGELVKLLQDLHAFSDSLDLCKFSAFAEGAEEYAAQYSAMTGATFNAADVLRTGERIYNLERLYNNRAGFGAGSDVLPARYTAQPSTMGGSRGHVCELVRMLEEYYAARGWRDGVVPRAKLEELGIP
ncbi:MAG: aldehyde ferredoxin oxidoreductase family protein [Planctomycetes bacterium]|nr:aldehyde ferredoxin oxidoreductase family protein [Planctomycetota bacterium]